MLLARYTGCCKSLFGTFVLRHKNLKKAFQCTLFWRVFFVLKSAVLTYKSCSYSYLIINYRFLSEMDWPTIPTTFSTPCMTQPLF